MSFLALLAVAVALLAIVGAGKLKRSSSPGNPLPPGPPFTVFLRKMFSFGAAAPYVTYTEWGKTYGDIIHTRVLGHDIIVLNSRQAAVDLLEKVSKKYSDRPALPTAELLGWDWATAFARYGPRFRLHRRLFHEAFNSNAALTYRPKQLLRAYELMTHLLHDHGPIAYEKHFTTFSASVVMAATYGYDVQGGDAFVALMQRASDLFLRAGSVESVVLSAALPYVKTMSQWFPGMRFMSKYAECRRLTHEAVNAPFLWTKERVEDENAAPSMVADAITRHKSEFEEEELVQAIKDAAGTSYGAAVGTTNAVLFVFVLAMMNNPEAQRRAQAEIDRVIGRQRLPGFGDRPSLPYVEGILRESLRWYPVSPVIPHASTEDNIYRGYHIPKGAMVLANDWAISRDESQYPNPDAFMPERFLQEDGTLNEDTVQWAFGFGRRICPGRHLADASLWCAIACILALFTIEKTEGSDNVKWMIGLAVHPEPFPCKFVPRDGDMDSEKLASLIYASRVDE